MLDTKPNLEIGGLDDDSPLVTPSENTDAAVKAS